MGLEWRTKRQLLFFVFFAVIILMIAGYTSYKLLPEPSCFDRRQNQDEAGVDCGGSCEPCLVKNAEEPIVLWTRFFESRPGVYDVAALVRNPNLSVGAEAVPYTFRLLDADGAHIVSKRGTLYLLPSQQFLVFTTGLVAGIRTPVQVSFTTDAFSWRTADEQQLPLSVTKTEQAFVASRPKLTLTVSNTSIRDVPHVDVSVLLSDEDGNAVAVGESHVDRIPDSGAVDVVFTWPQPFTQDVADIQTFIRRDPWRRF